MIGISQGPEGLDEGHGDRSIGISGKIHAGSAMSAGECLERTSFNLSSEVIQADAPPPTRLFLPQRNALAPATPAAPESL